MAPSLSLSLSLNALSEHIEIRTALCGRSRQASGCGCGRPVGVGVDSAKGMRSRNALARASARHSRNIIITYICSSIWKCVTDAAINYGDDSLAWEKFVIGSQRFWQIVFRGVVWTSWSVWLFGPEEKGDDDGKEVWISASRKRYATPYELYDSNNCMTASPDSGQVYSETARKHMVWKTCIFNFHPAFPFVILQPTN